MTELVACFKKNTWFSDRLLVDLRAAFNCQAVFNINYFEAGHRPLVLGDDRGYVYSTSTIVHNLAGKYSIPSSIFFNLLERRPNMRKVLFLLFLRKIIGLDYCMLFGWDVVLLKDIATVVEYAKNKTPFMVREYEFTSYEVELDAYFNACGLHSRYPQLAATTGYNSDFMGVDLKQLDCIDVDILSGLLQLKLEWQDQSVLTWLNWMSPRTKELSWKFHKYNHPFCYRQPVYHVSGTPNKEVLRFIYAYKDGRLRWPVAWMRLFVSTLPQEIRGYVWRMLK